jgi:recombination protein RecR
MYRYPESLQNLVHQLMKLPGIGRKTADRLAFHMVRMDAAEVKALAAGIRDVKERLTLCSTCQNLTERDPCDLCADASRDAEKLCVVEFPADVIAIEQSAAYRGRYFVLHGVFAPMQGIGPDELRLDRLVERVQTGGVSEVIVSTNLTMEGNATAAWIAERLKPLAVTVTRPACGIPVGGDLEYMDPVTIERSIRGRCRL